MVQWDDGGILDAEEQSELEQEPEFQLGWEVESADRAC